MRILVFTTCKPWKGSYERIQTNALRSWSTWKPTPTIVIFGDDEGSAEAARQFNVIHRPNVECGSSGFPKISAMFSQAEQLARFHRIDMLMFANADMVVVGLPAAVATVRKQLNKFLLVAYRREVREIDLDEPDWLENAQKRSTLGSPDAIDIFCFTAGLWDTTPEFVSGHVGFDNWLVMDVRERGLPIIDATQVVGAFHQAHDARLLHRPDDRFNLSILSEHEGGGSGEWAPRGRLTDANWLLVRDDLGASNPGDSKGGFLVRHRIRMQLVEMGDQGGPPALVPGGEVDPAKVRKPDTPRIEEPVKLEEITSIGQLVGDPIFIDRDEDVQPAVSARVQRILDRCSDGLRPATSDP